MISFEVKNGGSSEELDVVLDEKGLLTLLSQLRLLQEKRTDHVHLMAESWGGYDLAEASVDGAAKPMRHVKITLR